MLDTLGEAVLLIVSSTVAWFVGEWNARRKIKSQKNIDFCHYISNILSKDTIEFLHEHDHNNLIPKKYVSQIHSTCSKIYQNKDFEVVHDKKLKNINTRFLKSLQIYAESLSTLSFPHESGNYFTIDVIDPIANKGKSKTANILNTQASNAYQNYASLVRLCKERLYL